MSQDILNPSNAVEVAQIISSHLFDIAAGRASGCETTGVGFKVKTYPCGPVIRVDIKKVKA